MAAGQEHPEQFHKVKEETFRVLNGTLQLAIDDTVRVLNEGDTMLIPIYAKHAFKALTDVVIEELSTTSSPEDFDYTDARISSMVEPPESLWYVILFGVSRGTTMEKLARVCFVSKRDWDPRYFLKK